MSKTPEKMAEQFATDWHKDCDYPESLLRSVKASTKTVFLAGYQAAKDQLYEETGFRIKLFKNDDDAKAAYQEALEEVELDKIWQQGYQAAQEHAHAALEETEAEIDRLQTKLSDAGILTTEHIVDDSKMVSSSATLNNWISVKDRLPDKDTLIYFYAPKPGFYPNTLFGFWDNDRWYVGGEITPILPEDVTHWMPLPEPPKDAKE